MIFHYKLLIFYDYYIILLNRMEQTLFDFKRNGLYRNRIKDFFVDRIIPSTSMTTAHYHPYYELFYVLKGHCRIFAEHSLFSVQEGEIVILPEATLHRSQYEEKISVERITVSFTTEFLKDIAGLCDSAFLRENAALGKIHFTEKEKLKVEQIFDELLKENKNRDNYSILAKKSLLQQLFIILARNRNQLRIKDFENSPAEAGIQKAAQFIFENYSQDISLKQASEIAGMRDSYFSRKFRDVTGFGFKEYLTNLRLQHSMKMLAASSLSITQIASACGFSDGNYFGDAFRKKTGVSPAQFRKNAVNSE